MSQVEELHVNLAKVYECDIKQIKYTFATITDLEDNDRHVCLDLRFVLTYFSPILNKYAERTIYTAKIVVPDHIRQHAEDIKRNNTTPQPHQSGHPRAITHPGAQQPSRVLPPSGQPTPGNSRHLHLTKK